MSAIPPATGIRRLRPLLLALLPALLLATSACDERHEEGLRPPPILIRETVPADSALVSDGGGWPLTLNFRAPVEEDELKLRIFPAPDAVSAPTLSPSGMTLSYADVDLADGGHRHRLLLDAARMPRPRVLHYDTGSRPVLTIAGQVSTENARIARLDRTILFAYPGDAVIDPLGPESMLDFEPVAIAGVPMRPSDTVEAVFAIGSLHAGLYFIVGINDTNGDGEYDPNLDWWGYHRDFGSTSAQPLAAVAFATLAARVHLRPPGPISLSQKR